MYAQPSIDGLLSIESDGQTVLRVCDQDGEFENWLYSLVNELTNKPLSLLNELDVAWLQALNRVVERQVR
jgi:hypothetical protein